MGFNSGFKRLNTGRAVYVDQRDVNKVGPYNEDGDTGSPETLVPTFFLQ